MATYDGGKKADSISGDGSADSISGNNGDDSLFGGAGNDTIFGGKDNDLVYGGTDNDLVHGDSGNDTLHGDAGNDSVYGGDGDDMVYGGDGADRLYGDAGNDSVWGGEGNDSVNAGTGDDLTFGGRGDDTVYGEDGNDTLLGEVGNDALYGGQGADLGVGGSGNDTLDGGTENDTLSGGSGNDVITGGSGDDVLRGDTFFYTTMTGYASAGGGTPTTMVIGNTSEVSIDLYRINGAGVAVFSATIHPGESLSQSTSTTQNWLLTENGSMASYDVIPAPPPATYVFTNAFDDTLDGGTGNDLIHGELGNDLITGGAGLDSLYGGAGNDTVYGGDGNDYAELGDGNDTFGSFNDEGGNDTAYGGAGDDYMIGGSGDDQLYGDAGNDSLSGGIGSDSLYGGVGQDAFFVSDDHGLDYVDGGKDWDFIQYSNYLGTAGVSVTFTGTDAGSYSFGGGGASGTFTNIEGIHGTQYADMIDARADANGVTIEGQGGNDSITGGNGNDLIYGGEGNDTAFGGAGNDSIEGGSGSDSLLGDAGNDTIRGGTGSDTILGGAGNDQLFGGDDADRFVLEPDFGNDTIIGGEGGADSDLIDASGLAGGIVVTLTGTEAGTLTNTSSNLTFSEIEQFSLSGNNDTFYGTASSGAMTVDGGSGNDFITGGSSNDLLIGGRGDDTLTGGAGNDMLDGGEGIDTAVFTGPVEQYSFGYGQRGVMIVTDSVPGRDGTDTLSKIEYVEFNGVRYRLVQGDNGSNTTLQGVDDGTPSLIIAHDGNDWGGGHSTSDAIFGGAGADTLDGGAGDDTLSGDAGNDLLRGDDGADKIFGGEGSDTLQGGAGNDTLVGGDGADYLSGGDGDDSIDGGTGRDTIDGGAGDDLVHAGSEGDDVSGGEGADTLFGDDGDDLLRGNGGNDLVFGGTGRDTLVGGAGADTLEGGEGADTFALTGGGGGDVITDFDMTRVDGHTLDQLDVSDLRNAHDQSVTWRDVAVSGTNGDGTGNAVLTFPGGETVVLAGVSPEEASGKQNIVGMGIPCFGTGTPILTPGGWRAVECFRQGDLVLVRGGAAEPVIWAGGRFLGHEALEARPELRPVRIARGALGNTCDLLVSPQHAILMRLGGGEEVLVRALHLAQYGHGGFRLAWGLRHVGYHHLLLAEHAILTAGGAALESLYPGRMALSALDGPAIAGVAAAVFAARGIDGWFASGVGGMAEVYGSRVRRLLTGAEVAAALKKRILAVCPFDGRVAA